MELERFQPSYLLGIQCYFWKEYLYYPTTDLNSRRWSMPLLNDSRDKSNINSTFILSGEEFGMEEKGISEVAWKIIDHIGPKVLPIQSMWVKVKKSLNNVPLVCVPPDNSLNNSCYFHYFLNRQGACCNAEDPNAYIHILVDISLSINEKKLRNKEVEEIFHGLYDVSRLKRFHEAYEY